LAEIDSYQVLHHVLRTIWDGNFMSPIMHSLKSDNGANVLDICDITLDGDNLGPATLNFCEDNKHLDPEITYHLPTILSSTPTLSSEVHYELRTIPCGSWGGKVGEHHEQAVKDLVTKCYNEYLSPKAAIKVVEQILHELKDYRTKSYCHRIYVQKMNCK
ncbi:5140_t:CDS:2, partial [Racocetra fulgida]